MRVDVRLQVAQLLLRVRRAPLEGRALGLELRLVPARQRAEGEGMSVDGEGEGVGVSGEGERSELGAGFSALQGPGRFGSGGAARGYLSSSLICNLSSLESPASLAAGLAAAASIAACSSLDSSSLMITLRSSFSEMTWGQEGERVRG